MLSGAILAALWLAVLVLATCESVLMPASRARVHQSLKRPLVRARYAGFLERRRPMRSLCIVGRVCAAVGFVTLTLEQSQGLAAFLYAVVPLATAETGAKLLSRRPSATVLMALLPLLQVVWWAAWPFRSRRRAPAQARRRDHRDVQAAVQDIRLTIQDAASEGALHADEKEMIEGVLEFQDVEVHRLMTPRTDIECIEVDTPLAEAVRMAAGFRHTRIPVYEGGRDKLLGIVHVKDLLRATAQPQEASKSLREMLQQPLFIPKTKHALSLLRDFRQQHVQIAIILDEYGGVAGLVTLEDIVGEIVGDVSEWPKDMEDQIRRLGPDTFDMDARTRVEEIDQLLDADLPKADAYATVGGFLMQRFASVPRKGQELRCGNVLLRVLDSSDRRVLRVLVQRLKPEDEEDDEP